MKYLGKSERYFDSSSKIYDDEKYKRERSSGNSESVIRTNSWMTERDRERESPS